MRPIKLYAKSNEDRMVVCLDSGEIPPTGKYFLPAPPDHGRRPPATLGAENKCPRRASRPDGDEIGEWERSTPSFPGWRLGAPGCQLPDAVLHGKRRLRP